MDKPFYKKNSFLWLIVSLLVLLLVWILCYKGYLNIFNFASSSPGSYTLVSIKDLAQYPEKYVGKNITIIGGLSPEYSWWTMTDKQGYQIAIAGYCTEKQRVYEYNYYGQNYAHSYTAKGVFLPPEECKMSNPESCSYDPQYGYRLECYYFVQ